MSENNHVGYWINGRWTPWCEVFPEVNWPRKHVKAVPADLCPDCLYLALEDLDEEGG